MTLSNKFNNRILAIYKLLAAFFCISLPMGVSDNIKYLMRSGFNSEGTTISILAIFVFMVLLAGSVHILILPFYKGPELPPGKNARRKPLP